MNNERKLESSAPRVMLDVVMLVVGGLLVVEGALREGNYAVVGLGVYMILDALRDGVKSL